MGLVVWSLDILDIVFFNLEFKMNLFESIPLLFLRWNTKISLLSRSWRICVAWFIFCIMSLILHLVNLNLSTSSKNWRWLVLRRPTLSWSLSNKLLFVQKSLKLVELIHFVVLLGCLSLNLVYRRMVKI